MDMAMTYEEGWVCKHGHTDGLRSAYSRCCVRCLAYRNFVAHHSGTTLTRAQFDMLYQDGICPLCLNRMLTFQERGCAWSVTIDCIDPRQPATFENTWAICAGCNAKKGNWTPQMFSFSNWARRLEQRWDELVKTEWRVST